MAALMVSSTPPAGVAKEEIWKKCQSLAVSRAREKTREAMTSEKFYSFGTFAVGSLALGYLAAKFPSMEQVAGIDTKWIIGAAGVGYAFMGKGSMSRRALDVGMAALGPALYEQGANLALG